MWLTRSKARFAELRENSLLAVMDHEEMESVPAVSAAPSTDGVEHRQLTAEAAVADRVRVAMAPAETESARTVSAARSMDGAAPLRLTVEAAVADREVHVAMAPAEMESARTVSAALSMDGVEQHQLIALALAQALRHLLLRLLEVARLATLLTTTTSKGSH